MCGEVRASVPGRGTATAKALRGVCLLFSGAARRWGWSERSELVGGALCPPWARNRAGLRGAGRKWLSCKRSQAAGRRSWRSGMSSYKHPTRSVMGRLDKLVRSGQILDASRRQKNQQKSPRSSVGPGERGAKGRPSPLA